MLQEDYNDAKLSKQLRQMIHDRGHNMSSFAEECGFPESTIRTLCDPRKPFNPKTKTLVTIAETLDIPVSLLITLEDEPRD